ncbi:MAG: lipoate--protein ligase family protein [Candidatus Hydrogenedens sp.]|nr:lipoate--protein ligase family protein [Candidatus Hydrogenedens sp.]
MDPVAPRAELLRLTREEPSENLALDEALLESVCAGTRGDTVRLWESPAPFVVMGISQHIAEEVNESFCALDGIPVRRRCSAGGCVLQGPGSLNFSLVLGLHDHPEAQSLHASYRYILEPLCRAFAARGAMVEIAGLSDLALARRKVSGNAQRRKREAILHHGTLLYKPDYEGMARWLAEPAERPAYRGRRRHKAFVGALPFSREEIEDAVIEAYGAEQESEALPSELDLMRALTASKYELETWTRRR